MDNVFLQNIEMEDERKSETFSEQQRNAGRHLGMQFNPNQNPSLREKLIEPHYLTPDEVEVIVANMGRGCTLSNISKLSKSTMDSIKQVEFVDPKRNNPNVPRLQVGRAIYEHCVNMIIPCGEAFVMCVKYNVDVSKEIEKLSGKKEALTNAIYDRKQRLTTVHRPDMAVFQARIEIATAEKDAYLRGSYQAMFNTRLKTQTPATERTQTPGTTRTRSGSRSGAQSRAQTTGGDEVLASVEEMQDSGTPQTPTGGTSESWESSNEYARYQTDLKKVTEEVRLHMLKQFMAQQDSWEAFESSKGDIELEVRQLEEQKSDLQTLELLFQEVRNQMNLIVQKVKNAANPHTFICDKLKGQLVLNNDIHISQPYYSDNLCGIFHILHKEYSTPTFELFCTFLMDLLSITATAEELATNPYIVAQRTDAKLKMWLDFKFDTFMTRDNLFTVANLKALQGDIRRDCMTKVLERAHDIERNGGHSSDTVPEYQGMPLYSTLVRLEKTVSETSTFPSGQKKRGEPNPTPKPNVPDSTENAAAASEGEERRLVRDSPPYTSEIRRNQNLWSSNGFPYVATKVPCVECKDRTTTTHRPLCYGTKCTACGYFGHKHTACKHTPKAAKAGGGAGHS